MDFPPYNNDSYLIYSSSSIITFVNYIVLTYFVKYYTTCVIRTELDYVLLTEPIPVIVITIDQNFNETFQTAVDNSCQAFVVTDGALFEFLDSFIPVHDSSIRQSASKKLIVSFDGIIESTTLEKLRWHPSLLELQDILIISQSRDHDLDGSLDLLTTKFTNNGTRSTVDVEFQPVVAPDYYPEKFSNMNGVPIHLSTLMYPPYAYYEESDSKKANARYRTTFKKEDVPLFIDGTEVMLIVEFCRRYNCSVEASFDEVDLWGAVYENRTGTGLLGSVIERKAGIAVGAIYFWHQLYNYLSYTAPISRSGATVLVPKPRMLPPFLTPFLSFTGSLWTAVMVTFGVGFIAVWMVEKVRYRILRPMNELPVTISDTVLTMIGFYTAQGGRMRNDLVSCVMLFTSLLFMGFMVVNSYGGGLASVLTIPEYEKSIDTIVDLADSGINWGGTALAWIFSILNDSQPATKKLVKNYRVASDEYLAQHSKTQDMGFVGERTEFHHFVPSDFVDGEASTMLQLLKDDLYWASCAAIVTKTCPFKQKINDLIMLVKQSGIQHYWEMQAAYLYLRGTVQLNILHARQANSGNAVIKLTVSHFLGAYLILAAGLGMASLVFMIELGHSRLHGTVQKWRVKRIFKLQPLKQTLGEVLRKQRKRIEIKVKQTWNKNESQSKKIYKS